jgi:hypothetical protein
VAAIVAYLDPASGSLVVQLILGGVAAAAVTIKLWWQRLLRILHLRPREARESEAGPAAHD